MKYYHHDHHGEHDHGCCCHDHEYEHHHHEDGEHCCHEHEHHHDHEAKDPAALSELEKARMLLSHMLDHNRHHEEEMAGLAARLEAAGEPAAAKKVRSARARRVEANLALMEAVDLAAPKEEPAEEA